jgi:hypothetical protein
MKHPGVGDVFVRDGADGGRFKGGNGGGMAIEHGELDLVGGCAGVDMDYDTNIAGFQSLCWKRFQQYHALVFVEHLKGYSFTG